MQRGSAAYGGFRKQRQITRREAFLAGRDRVMPWRRLQALIEPHAPVAGNGQVQVQPPSADHHSPDSRSARKSRCSEFP